MSSTKRIFISAVSAELGESRRAVRDVLTTKGILPVVQDNFPPDYRAVKDILRSAVESCDAVICLIGKYYGREPKNRDESQPRRSYTQLEYDVARELNKPIFLFTYRGDPERDGAPAESGELQSLQLTHLQRITEIDQVRLPFASQAELRELVSLTDFDKSVEDVERDIRRSTAVLLHASIPQPATGVETEHWIASVAQPWQASVRKVRQEFAGDVHSESAGKCVLRFTNAKAAVNAALTLQHRTSDGETSRCRIAVHSGEILEFRGVSLSSALNISNAADLCAALNELSQPGQILLTRQPFDESRQSIAEHPVAGGAPLIWHSHGRYLMRKAEPAGDSFEEAFDVFEVGCAVSQPADTERLWSSETEEQERMRGWRPSIGKPIPTRDSWIIQSKLGEGGFGEAWLAEHQQTRRKQVFKFCFDLERLRSFRRELAVFRLLDKELEDRNDIVRLIEAQTDKPPFYLESEYVEAGNLEDWADAQGGLESIPLDERLRITQEICAAVAAAHSKGVFHRDLKPVNIFMRQVASGVWHPVLADFGIGALADSSLLKKHDITHGSLMQTMLIGSSRGSGTRMYKPPEADTGEHRGTTQADVYALGVMLFQMVTSDFKRPAGIGWEQYLPGAIQSAEASETGNCPDQHVWTELLRDDIRSAIHADPEQRLGSVDSLLERLKSLPDRADAELSRLATERIQRRNQRLRNLLTIAAVSLFIVGGLSIFSLLQWKNATDANERIVEMNGRLKDANWVLSRTIEDRDKANSDLTISNRRIQDQARDANENSIRVLTGSASRLHENGEVAGAFMQLLDAHDHDIDFDPRNERTATHRRFLRLVGREIAEVMHCVNLGSAILAVGSNDQDELHVVTASDHNGNGYPVFRTIKVKTFDVVNRHSLVIPLHHTVATCRISKDGSKVALLTVSRYAEEITELHVFSSDGKELGNPLKFAGTITECEFSPDGGSIAMLVANSNASELVCFDINRREQTSEVFPDGESPLEFVFDQDKKSILLIGKRGRITKWTPWGDSESQILLESSSVTVPMVISTFFAEQKWHLAVGGQNTVALTTFESAGDDTESRQKTSTIPIAGACRQLGFSTDGSMLQITALDTPIYDLGQEWTGGECVLHFVATKDGQVVAPNIRTSASGSLTATHWPSGLIACRNHDQEFGIWRVMWDKHQVFRAASCPDEVPVFLGFGADGEVLFCATESGGLLAWNLCVDVLGNEISEEVSSDTSLAAAGIGLRRVAEAVWSKDRPNPLVDLPIGLGDQLLASVRLVQKDTVGELKQHEDYSRLDVFLTEEMRRLGNLPRLPHSSFQAASSNDGKLLAVGYRSVPMTPLPDSPSHKRTLDALDEVPRRSEVAEIGVYRLHDSTWEHTTTIDSGGKDLLTIQFGDSGFLYVGTTTETNGCNVFAINPETLERTQVMSLDTGIWKLLVSSDEKHVVVLTHGFGLELATATDEGWKETWNRNAVFGAAISEHGTLAIVDQNDAIEIRRMSVDYPRRFNMPNVRRTSDNGVIGFPVLFEWQSDNLVFVRDDGLVWQLKGAQTEGYDFIESPCRGAAVDDFGLLTTVRRDGWTRWSSLRDVNNYFIQSPPVSPGSFGQPGENFLASTKRGLLFLNGNNQRWIPSGVVDEEVLRFARNHLFSQHKNGQRTRLTTREMSGRLDQEGGLKVSALEVANRRMFNGADSEKLTLEDARKDTSSVPIELVPEWYEATELAAREAHEFESAAELFQMLVDDVLVREDPVAAAILLGANWTNHGAISLEAVPKVWQRFPDFFSSQDYFDASVRTQLHFAGIGAATMLGDDRRTLEFTNKFLNDRRAVELETKRQGFGLSFSHQLRTKAARALGDVSAMNDSLNWLQSNASKQELVLRSSCQIAADCPELKGFRRFVVDLLIASLDERPDDGTTIGWLGQLKVRDEEYPEAVELLTQAIDSSPSELLNANEGHNTTTLLLYLAIAEANLAETQSAQFHLQEAEDAYAQGLQKRSFAGQNSGDRRYRQLRDEVLSLLSTVSNE